MVERPPIQSELFEVYGFRLIANKGKPNNNTSHYCNEIVTDFKLASKRARRFVAFNEEALAQPMDFDNLDQNLEAIDIDGDALRKNRVGQTSMKMVGQF